MNGSLNVVIASASQPSAMIGSGDVSGSVSGFVGAGVVGAGVVGMAVVGPLVVAEPPEQGSSDESELALSLLLPLTLVSQPELSLSDEEESLPVAAKSLDSSSSLSKSLYYLYCEEQRILNSWREPGRSAFSPSTDDRVAVSASVAPSNVSNVILNVCA